MLHDVTFVTSCWLLSLNVAVAVNCSGLSQPRVGGVEGLIVRVLTLTLLTVSTAFSDISESEAVTTTPPGCDASTKPCVGAVLLTVAEFVPGQAHCTCVVTSFVLPSE